MPHASRRELLRAGAGLLVVGATAAQTARAAGSNERIRVALIGCGGMGMHLLRSFAQLPDAIVTHVCDVDAHRRQQAVAEVEKVGAKAPAIVEDLRRVLDNSEIDAVVIATPDHWHAPAAILACQAGKHVYVEKPCGHNLREGRLMVQATRRHKRVMQVGTQSRSIPHVVKAIQLLREGVIGDVYEATAWCNQLRGNIGRQQPGPAPDHINYDLWVGPAPFVGYRSNCVHANWRWFYNFGTGDIGNDGVHELDIARWGLGVDTHPTAVTGMGGKFFFDDDQEFPDTYRVIYDYPADGRPGRRKRLTFELRNWCPYPLNGYANGNAFYGTKGMMILGKDSGWQILGPDGRPGEQMKHQPFDSTHHHLNFLDCIRTGRTPNADIEIGHLSAALSHLGNIAVRTGQYLHFDPEKEQINEGGEANHLLRRQYREGHWATPQGV